MCDERWHGGCMSARAAAFHSAWSPATAGRQCRRRLVSVLCHLTCQTIVEILLRSLYRYIFISIFMD